MSWADQDVDALLSGGGGGNAWGEVEDDAGAPPAAAAEEEEEGGAKAAWAGEEEEDEAAAAAEAAAKAKAAAEGAALAAEKGPPKAGGKRAERKAEAEAAARRAALEAQGGAGAGVVLDAAALKKAQEDSDFQNAEDLFGGLANAINTKSPRTEADFTELAKQLAHQLAAHSKSRYYGHFLKELVREASDSLDAAELRDISSSINGLANTKLQAAAPKKRTKGKVKVNIKMATGEDEGDARGVSGAGDGVSASHQYEDELDFM